MKSLYFFIFIINLLLASNFLWAQTSEKEKRNLFGAGLFINNQFWSNDQDIEPVQKLLFSFAPVSWLKAESAFGYALTKRKNPDYKIETYFLGLSGYYTFTLSDFYVSTGIRYGFSKYKNDVIKTMNYYNGIEIHAYYGSFFNNTNSVKTEEKTITFSPVFRLEYLIKKHFGLGTEIAVDFSSTTSSVYPQYYPFDDIKEDRIALNSNITLSYYF